MPEYFFKLIIRRVASRVGLDRVLIISSPTPNATSAVREKPNPTLTPNATLGVTFESFKVL